jgi:hypothetical protein
MAPFTAAARMMCPCDASLDGAGACAKEQLDNAAGEDFEAPWTIADAVMAVAGGERRDLQ